ncbi:hypothetical protein [Micromonospora haikouensis]|uniref:hypothetical protein n=1 Tax=Micromonospora haikouensis TaxID=686309 RepID=UPI000AF9375F
MVESAAFDRVAAAARAAGLSGPVEIAPAVEAGSAWAVTQVDNTWPVAVDPAGGEVTARSDFADWPLLAKLSGLGIQAHMGLLFGLVNQILLAALALRASSSGATAYGGSADPPTPTAAPSLAPRQPAAASVVCRSVSCSSAYR